MRTRLAVSLLSGVLLASCSSSSATGPGGGPGAKTHPAGVIDTTSTILPGSPHGIAISSRGQIVAPMIDIDTVEIAAVSPFALGPLVPASRIPVDVSIAPDGNTAYVANEGRFVLSVINIRTGTEGDSIHVPPSSGVLRVLVHPNGSRIYVTDGVDLGGPTTGHVYVIALPSRTVVDSIAVPGDANGIAFDSASNRLYVSSTGGTVTEIDATADTVMRTLHAGATPEDIAISHDHGELWVADHAQGVKVFDLATGDSLATIPSTSTAFGLKITPDGTQVYATLEGVNRWVIIDRASRTEVNRFTGFFGLARIAFDATGAHAAIADGYRITVVK